MQGITAEGSRRPGEAACSCNIRKHASRIPGAGFPASPSRHPQGVKLPFHGIDTPIAIKLQPFFAVVCQQIQQQHAAACNTCLASAWTGEGMLLTVEMITKGAASTPSITISIHVTAPACHASAAAALERLLVDAACVEHHHGRGYPGHDFQMLRDPKCCASNENAWTEMWEWTGQ